MRFEDALKRECVTRHFLRLKSLKAADPEFLHTYRLDALKRLLHHAYRNVPFYRRRFENLGLHPQDVKTFDDYVRIPPLSRDDVRNHGQEMKSEDVDEAKFREGRSSGSTGEPITFYHDVQSHSASRAAVLFGWELGGKSLGDKFTTIWGNRTTVEETWSKPGSRFKAKIRRNTRIPAFQLTSDSRVQDAIELMLKQKGGFVQGYTNAIYTIAHFAHRQGIRFEPKFNGVLTTAETLFPYQRKIIEEIMGPVYDGYGSQEIQGIAFQCREQRGYHVVEPNVILETGDSYGKSKEIILTDLWNYAWPLIRYRIGDLTSGEWATCSCGCTWKVISSLEGRTSDIISTPDGGFIDIIAWDSEDFDKHAHLIDRFQFAKVAPDKVVLRLEIKDDHRSIVDDIKNSLAPYFKGVMDFDVQIVDKFAMEKSGKYKMIIDETTS
jgi:phenylacetate-CoA ligase